MLDPINATDPVSGQAEPGSTVTVTYPDGTTATLIRLHQMHRCLIRSMQQTQ
ncbi:putative biofilm associated protein [Acinetobacter baumannii 44467_9]|nr:putative biofilm associated protein [Acinetobacter baumannii 44467_9]